jgi:drug/metabolite transporter (DMT)-like permease
MIMSSTSSHLPFPEPSRQDCRGWLVSIFSGIGAGILIGSGSSGLLHFDRMGPVFAGVAVALLTASLARTRLVVKTLLAGFIVVGACMLTITLRHWSTGHWPVGHIDGKWPLIVIALAAYVCLPATGLSFLIAAMRRKRAEPGAAPNGGPATQSGNSGATEGPPSVS